MHSRELHLLLVYPFLLNKCDNLKQLSDNERMLHHSIRRRTFKPMHVWDVISCALSHVHTHPAATQKVWLIYVYINYNACEYR